MIGRTLGHYRVIDKIGEGGMGVVYRAHDARLDRDVALKVLPAGALADENSRKRFRREAHALAKLSHPHIASIHDFNSEGDVDFLVMEYLRGASLREKLMGGALPEKETIALGMQIAGALEEAHEHGIVHRDLKPDNVVLTAKGQAKVLDFGLARLVRPGNDATTADSLSLTDDGAGTLPYMAPEQLRGEPADARTDIYSTGALLYEMATGRRPFEQKLVSALIGDILHNAPPAPGRINPKISARLEEIIQKCLDKEPGNRYQTAKELVVDLRRLSAAAAGSENSSSVKAAGEAARRSGSLWWRAVLAAMGLLLVLGVVIGLNANRWRGWLTGSADMPRIQSLAVLPLANLSADPEQEFFADGMTEALITDLSKIHAVRVISRTSVMQYKGANKPVHEIGRELNVDAAVSGTVTRAQNRVRISVQLADARSDRNLWAENYEGDIREVMDLQSRIAQAIADEIRVQVTAQESAALSKKRNVNPQAYETYLQARYLWNKRTPQDLRKALVDFKKALDLDSSSALAWAGLADGYSLLAYYDEEPPRQAMPAGKAAAKKALELDDSLAEAHASLANVEWAYDWDLTAAEKEFERALTLDPNYATAHEWHGLYLNQAGKFDEGLAEMQRARELDPLSLVIQVNIGRCHYYARHYDKAVDVLRQLEQQEPNFWIVHAILGQVYLAMGRFDEAIRELERARTLSPDSLRNWGVLGDAYGRAGRQAQALKLAEELADLSRKRYVPPVYAAMINVGLAKKTLALTALEKAYDERSDWIMQLKIEPEFDPLRGDPQFRKLLREAAELPQLERKP